MFVRIQKWWCLLVTCSLTIVVLCGSTAYAVNLRVTDMFPGAQGENGWYAQSYGSTSKLIRNLELAGDHSFTTPIATDANGIPSMTKTLSGISIQPGYSTTDGDRWAVLTFKNLGTTVNTYSFSVRFANGSAVGATAKAMIYYDPSGATYLSGTKLYEGLVNSTKSALFSSSMILNPQDRLRFVISGLGNPTNDIVLLTDVTSTPEPGSLAALASSLIGFIVMRRRK